MLLWSKTYGATNYSYNDFGYCVRQTQDLGYIVTGWSSSGLGGGYDVYLIKTNDIGDTLWTKSYGAYNEEKGYSVEQTKDGGYIIAGEAWSFEGGLNHALL